MREAATPLRRASSPIFMCVLRRLDIQVDFKLRVEVSSNVKSHADATMKLFTPLVLPNGAVIPNRLAKAAMEENMADADHAPSDALLRLYEAWAAGGAGLILTGNVMIDHRAMTGPNGVVL